MKNSESSPKKRKSNRGKIVEAAITCFVEQGIHQTSIRDIAERAGVSQGNMYNHFASKEALIVEIADLNGAGIEETLAAGDDLPPARAIDAICKAHLTRAMQTWRVVLGLEITVQALRSPEIAEAFTSAQEKLRNRLTALIEAGQEDGSFPAGSPIERVEMALDLLSSFARRHGLRESEPSDASLQMLWQCIDQILGR